MRRWTKLFDINTLNLLSTPARRLSICVLLHSGRFDLYSSPNLARLQLQLIPPMAIPNLNRQLIRHLPDRRPMALVHGCGRAEPWLCRRHHRTRTDTGLARVMLRLAILMQMATSFCLAPEGLEERRPPLMRLMREMAVSTSERLPYRWRVRQAIRPRAAISAA